MVLPNYVIPELTYCLILQTFVIKVNAYYDKIGNFSEPTKKSCFIACKHCKNKKEDQIFEIILNIIFVI